MLQALRVTVPGTAMLLRPQVMEKVLRPQVMGKVLRPQVRLPVMERVMLPRQQEMVRWLCLDQHHKPSRCS